MENTHTHSRRRRGSFVQEIAWPMMSDVGVVLPEGFVDPENINPLEFLESSHTALKQDLTRFNLGDLFRNPHWCILERVLREEIQRNIPNIMRKFREKMFITIWNPGAHDFWTLEEWAWWQSSDPLEAIPQSILDKAAQSAYWAPDPPTTKGLLFPPTATTGMDSVDPGPRCVQGGVYIL
ncbi:unnamed protein product [Trypanosoma congolense IL3000]|uniref:WGS project CAEQ00000000 data, annotated contig 849 n=1 Tax=Trypanosoma congolense (strain IL3000) TaxID=1068625 RepID=F9WIY8_TRYCI|nr:unnamed protein product [Trypanosoma congolense IL3000]